MFRRTILAALAFAAEGGDDHLARRALSRVDPLVALWCRPLVAKAIVTASSLVADRTDRTHVLRLAYLYAASALGDLDYEDRAAVGRAFEAHAAGAGPIRPYRYVSVLTLATAFAALSAAAVHHSRAKPWDPREARLGRALADDLPSFVASVANASRSGDNAPDAGPTRARPIDEDSRDRVIHAVADDLGAVGGDAARALLLGYQAAALSPTDDRALDDMMYGALQRTNGTLRDARRLYWLDIIGDGRSGPLVVSYYVARSSAVHVDGVAIPLLHLQRLDSLNRSLRRARLHESPRRGGGGHPRHARRRGRVAPAACARGRRSSAHRRCRDRETRP